MYGNYVIVLGIGAIVGATELMSRYRDAPFLPLLSLPGVVYTVLNGGAAILAYYLLGVVGSEQFGGTDPKTQVYRILLASLGAMTIFRSGLFTLRLGDADVSIGPNLILQVLLTALDRSYDRLRAAPRSIETGRIMAGVSFELAAPALPSFCFNLMQNVTEEERSDVVDEIESLRSVQMSDEARTLILGLRLFNVVGANTLEQAVNALGGTIRGSKKLELPILTNLAKLSSQPNFAKSLDALPNVVRALCHNHSRHISADEISAIASINLVDDSRAILIVHALVRHYGQDVVSNAIESLILSAANTSVLPDPAAPPPGPPPTG